LIRYDRRRLTPASLWNALCACGLVSGVAAISDSVTVTRLSNTAAAGNTTETRLIAALSAAAAEKLIERLAIALMAALI
jgi:hypothetical protein